MEETTVKCHLCGGTATLHFEELKLGDGKIIIKNSPYYACQKCREEFATSQQMEELNHLVHTKFSFSRPIINAGRSLAITIPSDLASYYQLKKGERLRLIPENKKEFKVVVES